ncbi:MAG: hypothetical protein OXN83_00155 [Oligoflexia bacterium]|nr:hypothetical protein [Oligoflexia bacterium]
MVNKTFILSCGFFFMIIGCAGGYSDVEQRVFTGFEKYTEYVEGKGYCVSKYDERGCNSCGLSYVAQEWSWICTQKYCFEVNQEKVNLCTQYFSKEKVEEYYNLK